MKAGTKVISADGAQAARAHYRAGDDAERARVVANVMKALDDLGPGLLSASQLAPLDQFHVRGLVATAELAQLAGLDASSQVLDAGSGLGGPARFLAETHGCEVTGVDLSPTFVALARELARRSPVAGRVHFDVADLCDLPIKDGRFDRVWTQHALMNVHDRAAAYAEFRRVLVPGGKLAFYDVIAADGKPDLVYPVPWAPGPALSHLLTRSETVAALAEAGFTLRQWNDVTELALNWFSQTPPAAPGSLGLGAVMGPGFPEMAKNLSVNLRQGRIRLAMGVFEPDSDPAGRLRPTSAGRS
jgi:SAM-dependent methyltransferase